MPSCEPAEYQRNQFFNSNRTINIFFLPDHMIAYKSKRTGLTVSGDKSIAGP